MDIDERALSFDLPGRRYLGGNSSLRTCRYEGRSYLYKNYTPGHLAQLDEAALRGMVRWREHLSDADRARLDEIAAWPQHVVTLHTRPTGVLMLEAGPSLLMQRDGRLRARTFSELITFRGAGAVRHGVSLAAKQRAVAHAVRCLLWLHELGVTMVDVQPDNLLSTNDGRQVFLVDCDVAWGPWGQPARPEAPEHMQAAVPQLRDPSPATDLARMAWIALFLVTDDHMGERVSAGVIGDRDATFLRGQMGARPADDSPTDAWRELAKRWAEARDEPVARTQRTTRPRWKWLPDEFIVPDLYHRMPPPVSQPSEPVRDDVPQVPSRRWIPVPLLVFGLVLVVGLLLFEAYRGGLP